jgi:hypothetical protein
LENCARKGEEEKKKGRERDRERGERKGGRRESRRGEEKRRKSKNEGAYVILNISKYTKIF